MRNDIRAVSYTHLDVYKRQLLDRVCASLKDAGLEYVLLGGVVPNPQLSMVKKGVRSCYRKCLSSSSSPWLEDAGVLPKGRSATYSAEPTLKSPSPVKPLLASAPCASAASLTVTAALSCCAARCYLRLTPCCAAPRRSFAHTPTMSPCAHVVDIARVRSARWSCRPRRRHSSSLHHRLAKLCDMDSCVVPRCRRQSASQCSFSAPEVLSPLFFAPLLVEIER